MLENVTFAGFPADLHIKLAGKCKKFAGVIYVLKQNHNSVQRHIEDYYKLKRWFISQNRNIKKEDISENVRYINKILKTIGKNLHQALKDGDLYLSFNYVKANPAFYVKLSSKFGKLYTYIVFGGRHTIRDIEKTDEYKKRICLDDVLYINNTMDFRNVRWDMTIKETAVSEKFQIKNVNSYITVDQDVGEDSRAAIEYFFDKNTLNRLRITIIENSDDYEYFLHFSWMSGDIISIFGRPIVTFIRDSKYTTIKPFDRFRDDCEILNRGEAVLEDIWIYRNIVLTLLASIENEKMYYYINVYKPEYFFREIYPEYKTFKWGYVEISDFNF